MIIRKKLAAWVLLGMIVAAVNCTPDDRDDEIAFVPFADIVINLSLPEYFVLQSTGGYKLISEGGVRGLILYHTASGGYVTFERNCSYHPADACATVEVDVTQVRLVDPCCGSYFGFDGNPISGPAWRPLRQYVTLHQGNEVIITDEIAN